MKRLHRILGVAMSVGVTLAIVALCFAPGVSFACFANFQTGCITTGYYCYEECANVSPAHYGCAWCYGECGSGFLYVGYYQEDTWSCDTGKHNCICIDECGGDPC